MDRQLARGEFSLPQTLTVAQAADVLAQALRSLAGKPAPWRIQAGELLQFDSSCLAVLMEVRRRAGDAGVELLGVPHRLRNLADAYGVAFVVDPGAASPDPLQAASGDSGR